LLLWPSSDHDRRDWWSDTWMVTSGIAVAIT
jgi:hypothetical protein